MHVYYNSTPHHYCITSLSPAGVVVRYSLGTRRLVNAIIPLSPKEEPKPQLRLTEIRPYLKNKNAVCELHKTWAAFKIAQEINILTEDEDFDDAGLVLGALGSKKLPRILPIPLPIPVHLDEHKEFSGGHYGNDYYNHHPVGLAPAYGPGGYSYGAGGFGAGVYGGGGYAAEGGWW
ncbi:hypothetical protein TNCT_615581 [Trichonephila clavata]|uniref:Uncharacterized protein n=1 Tax=Trichonephila clavata TaxID=2740835 RepID=A0A8X6GJZ4_TRICU|nr:hypothetical protein TNCT_615581 [Trichonephila clavata]